MNPEKVSRFIKELRKKEGLTQKDLASKYNVTYQAVSKWETAKNIPDIAILKQMCEDYNLNLDELLEGERKQKKSKKILLISLISLILLLSGLAIYYATIPREFEFKTLNASCKDFTLSGSIAYNKSKTAIYISNIDYCGENPNEKYTNISCKLYEVVDGAKTEIKSATYEGKAITLSEYLKTVEFNIDHYSHSCKMYLENALQVEIEATKENKEPVKYQIPLTLKDNCSL